MTEFSPDFSPDMNSIQWSDDPYRTRGGSGGIIINRVQLTETLHPCGQAEALVVRIGVLPEGGDDTFKNRGDVSLGETLIVDDPYGVNFGGRGEWFDVIFRGDLKQYHPIGSKGLVRRCEVVDAEMDLTDLKGDFRVMRPETIAGDPTNNEIKVEAHFKFFADYLPRKFKIGDRFLLVYFHDSYASVPTKLVPSPTDPDFLELEPWKLAVNTGRWEVMPANLDITFIGWVTTNIPAAVSIADQPTGEPGTTAGNNVRLQQLDDATLKFIDCKDGDDNIISIKTFNMCDTQVDSGQRIQGKWIKGHPFVDTVCCPPPP